MRLRMLGLFKLGFDLSLTKNLNTTFPNRDRELGPLKTKLTFPRLPSCRCALFNDVRAVHQSRMHICGSLMHYTSNYYLLCFLLSLYFLDSQKDCCNAASPSCTFPWAILLVYLSHTQTHMRANKSTHKYVSLASEVFACFKQIWLETNVVQYILTQQLTSTTNPYNYIVFAKGPFAEEHRTIQIDQVNSEAISYNVQVGKSLTCCQRARS